MSHVAVLGCRVDVIDTAGAVARILTCISERRHATVVTLGTEMAVYAHRDPAFRAIVNAASLSLCDTVGIRYAARLHGETLPERISGIDLIDHLCAALARDRRSIYLLGAKGDTAARTGVILAARYPGLVIAGTRDGYFAETQNADVAAAIAATGADLLFVGLGSPRQERWLAAYVAAAGVGAGIGIGGSFDVIAGNVRRAPEVWRKLNLEWFFRLVQEPRRWRRQLALPIFVFLAVRERLHRIDRRLQS